MRSRTELRKNGSGEAANNRGTVFMIIAFSDKKCNAAL